MLPNSRIRVPVAISLGAIAGALLRYYLGLWFLWLCGPKFPYGTLIINVSGCFIMGFFATISLGRGLVTISPEIRLLVATGFLGSYTTFSSYELDTAKLLEQHHSQLSLLYWLISAILGLFGFLMGTALAEFIRIKKQS